MTQEPQGHLPPSAGEGPGQVGAADRVLTDADHPAKFNQAVLDAIRTALTMAKVQGWVLDPFAGVGKIHELRPDFHTFHVEIEPEWEALAAQRGPGVCMDFFDFVPDVPIAAIATSPCVTPDMRVLTSDLRWVPAGDLQVGDRLLAFDEQSPGLKVNGQAHRRRYQWSEVVWAQGARKDCARVHLADGSVITTTLDHPWLGMRSAGYSTQEWITTAEMRPGITQVLKQFEPWPSVSSWDAGWLAGMFDGEGSLSFGRHGTPKMQLCQVRGPVSRAVMRKLREMGHEINVLPRTLVEGRRQVDNVYIVGGWPGMVRALGQLRPMRLLDNFVEGDVSSRTIQPERVLVEAVEFIGKQDIAGIETSTGTLIVEGFLHHNTYGNRMADQHTPSPEDTSERNTYTHKLGRKVSEGSSANLQWGDEYRDFHHRAWRHAVSILQDAGLLVVNVKDHIRDRKRQPVVAWHKGNISAIPGMRYIATVPVPVRGLRQGENHEARVDHEFVLVFQKGSIDGPLPADAQIIGKRFN